MNNTITEWDMEVHELKIITRIIMQKHDGFFMEPSFDDSEEICVLLKTVFDRLESLELTMDTFLKGAGKDEE